MKRAGDDAPQPPPDPRQAIRRRLEQVPANVRNAAATTGDRLLALLAGHHPRAGYYSPLQDVPIPILHEIAAQIRDMDYVCQFALRTVYGWELRQVCAGAFVTAARYAFPAGSGALNWLLEAPTRDSVVYRTPANQDEFCVYNRDGSAKFRDQFRTRASTDIPRDASTDVPPLIAATKDHVAVAVVPTAIRLYSPAGAVRTFSRGRMGIAREATELRPFRGKFDFVLRFNGRRAEAVVLDPVAGTGAIAPWPRQATPCDAFNFHLHLEYFGGINSLGKSVVGYEIGDAYREVRFDLQAPSLAAFILRRHPAAGMIVSEFSETSHDTGRRMFAIYAPPVVAPSEEESAPALPVAATYGPVGAFAFNIIEALPDVACIFSSMTSNVVFVRRDDAGRVSLAQSTLPRPPHKIFGLNARNRVVGAICNGLGGQEILHVIDARNGTIVASETATPRFACTPILRDLLL